MRLVAMAEQEAAPSLDEAWNLALLSDDEAYLVPENKREANYPAFVLIDDTGYFRGYVDIDDPQLQLKQKKKSRRL